MTDILEHEGHLGLPNLCTEQIVMVVLQLAVRKMIPPESATVSTHIAVAGDDHVRARVSVEQRRRLDVLPSVPAPLALERLVRLAERVLVKQEEFPKCVQREVSLDVFLLVHYRR